jgi:hypothetical protein
VRAIGIAALAIVAILSPRLELPADRPACSPTTEVKLITPFQNGNLGIGYAVTSRGSGECFASSAAVPARPDAWRCTIGNAIHDPCFQNVMGDHNLLACPQVPWNANVILLTLKSPLPAEARKNIALKGSLPWALELANGQRCTMFTGATAPIAGMRINYGCPGGFIAVGDIDQSQPVWRVFSQGEKSLSLDLTDIVVAWY